MASLYQRFSGKINTSRSFPVPPEASHLLGAQCSEEDGAAGKTPRPLQQESSRPRFQYQPRSDCEEEDVSAGLARVWVGSVSGTASKSCACRETSTVCPLILHLFPHPLIKNFCSRQSRCTFASEKPNWSEPPRGVFYADSARSLNLRFLVNH
uniref:Uncharacterized protein n=2 Tax=Anas TaxID=8835 RepID=A0A8B9UKJ9_9AVES